MEEKKETVREKEEKECRERERVSERERSPLNVHTNETRRKESRSRITSLRSLSVV